MTDPTPSDIKDELGPTGVSDAAIQKVIDRSKRLKDTVFSGRVRAQGEIEGNQDDFWFYLACHLVTIDEGGETGTESQSGGSVSFAHLSPQGDRALNETRYGRTAQLYLRDELSIGVEKT